jgi:hypothetical protein
MPVFRHAGRHLETVGMRTDDQQARNHMGLHGDGGCCLVGFVWRHMGRIVASHLTIEIIQSASM